MYIYVYTLYDYPYLYISKSTSNFKLDDFHQVLYNLKNLISEML